MVKRVLVMLSILLGVSVPGLLRAQTAADADFDGSGTVDFPDFLKFAGAFGSAQAEYDLNRNGSVDFSDFLAFAGFFGQKIEGLPSTNPRPQQLTVLLPNDVAMGFVWIEPGAFVRGSPKSESGRYDVEGPQHEVTITQGFYLSRYEVTQAQWEAVTGARPWSNRSHVQDKGDHPAVYVSVYDIDAFIRNLNVAAGDSLYRLPTEAEWEFAARAGTQTAWSFGGDENRLKEYAWYRDNAWQVGEQYAHKVGTKGPNPWGLHDMHGNAYELVADWWGSYSGESLVDPAGPPAGSLRVIRGGSFNMLVRNTRSAERYWCKPWERLRHIGFRLLKRVQ